tara:strand:+ start:286 stop:675 length:390 start_codon:yes stop_codon:yes gene_type:complete
MAGFSIRMLIVPPPSDSKQPRKLNPLPKGLVELYGLMAVLMVIIPEWLAEITLSMGNSGTSSQLPMTARAWRTLPELQVAAMSLYELRQMARQLKIWGYSSDSRDELAKRLLKRLQRGIPTQWIKPGRR